MLQFITAFISMLAQRWLFACRCQVIQTLNQHAEYLLISANLHLEIKLGSVTPIIGIRVVLDIYASGPVINGPGLSKSSSHYSIVLSLPFVCHGSSFDSHHNPSPELYSFLYSSHISLQLLTSYFHRRLNAIKIAQDQVLLGPSRPCKDTGCWQQKISNRHSLVL